jgi:catechol 2,3-dioxygenase-like lactoylglutathione lyase family enzyme
MHHRDAPATPTLLSRLPLRLHHYAFVVRDQEANRRFFEDVLGLPRVATWCERVFNTDVQREVAYCHTFFAPRDLRRDR